MLSRGLTFCLILIMRKDFKGEEITSPPPKVVRVTAESMDVIDFNYGTYNRTQETMMGRILGKRKGYSSKL